jgi:hypothetical protein
VHQRARRTAPHGDVGAAEQAQHPARVAGGGVHVDVAEHRRHREHVDGGVGERDGQRVGVVHAGVGVDDQRNAHEQGTYGGLTGGAPR